MIRQLCLGFAFLLLFAATAHASMVSIDRAKVNLRSGPGQKYATLWEVGRGFPLKVIGNQGNWYKVTDFENDAAWVYKPLVAKKPHMVVKTKRVNIRSNPGDNHPIVGKADYGVVLKTVKQSRGWVQVRHENGLTGWVRRDLLWGW